MDNQQQERGRNFQTVLSEMAAYGEYEPKTLQMKVLVSESEREAFRGLADALDVSMSLLFRVMLKRAIQEYEQHGISPLGDFEVKR